MQVSESSGGEGQQEAAPITGRAADVVAAAQTALEAALRLIRPGKRISDVPDTLSKVVEAYGCNLVEGVMSHQMKQFVIDANKCVLNRPSPEHKVEDGEFEENEVYAIDIVVSTGEGKPKVCTASNPAFTPCSQKQKLSATCVQAAKQEVSAMLAKNPSTRYLNPVKHHCYVLQLDCFQQ